MDACHSNGLDKKTFGAYALGFMLCIFLTIIPFYAVMHQLAPRHILVQWIFMAAAIQFFVQVFCFLRLKSNCAQGQMQIWSFVFTGLIAAVVIGGSLWIMINLNYNMMH